MGLKNNLQSILNDINLEISGYNNSQHYAPYFSANLVAEHSNFSKRFSRVSEFEGALNAGILLEIDGLRRISAALEQLINNIEED